MAAIGEKPLGLGSCRAQRLQRMETMWAIGQLQSAVGIHMQGGDIHLSV